MEVRIVCAAMLMKDGHIVTGVRHFSPDMRATLRRLYPRCWLARLLGLRDKYHLQVAEQGFITNYGHFVSREVALNLALISGQIISGRTNGELFSEDLY